jgi:quinol monooxygenase YgiN
MTTIIVTGWLRVDPEQRDAYVQECRGLVERARATEGCLDFALTACSVDPGRVVVAERWTSRAALDAFRGAGVEGEQAAQILDAAVDEYETGGGTRL